MYLFSITFIAGVNESECSLSAYAESEEHARQLLLEKNLTLYEGSFATTLATIVEGCEIYSADKSITYSSLDELIQNGHIIKMPSLQFFTSALSG